MAKETAVVLPGAIFAISLMGLSQSAGVQQNERDEARRVESRTISNPARFAFRQTLPFLA